MYVFLRDKYSRILLDYDRSDVSCIDSCSLNVMGMNFQSIVIELTIKNNVLCNNETYC